MEITWYNLNFCCTNVSFCVIIREMKEKVGKRGFSGASRVKEKYSSLKWRTIVGFFSSLVNLKSSSALKC